MEVTAERALVTAAGVMLAMVLMTACAPAMTFDPTPFLPDIPPAPPGFRLEHAGSGRSPTIERIADTPRTTPLTTSIAVFVADAELGTSGEEVDNGSEAGADPSASPGLVATRPVITLTLATYADPTGALAAYNNWFAVFGFMSAAERTVLDLGDQAERFDVGWPPLHVALARAGPRLILAEASEAVPADQRGALLEALAQSAMTEERP